jgi:hypothetical protein
MQSYHERRPASGLAGQMSLAFAKRIVLNKRRNVF